MRGREDSRIPLTFLTQMAECMVEPPTEPQGRGWWWCWMGGYNRVEFKSVGFEELVGFVSGAPEGCHLISRIELVGGDLHARKRKRRGAQERKLGECQHLKTC